MLTPSIADTYQQKYLMGQTSFQHYNEPLIPQTPIDIMPSYQQQLWLQQSLQPSYIPGISPDYSFRDITLRLQPPPLMHSPYSPYLEGPAIKDYSLDNITLMPQSPPSIYSPRFEMPTIRDYSLDNIRLMPPPTIIYEPPTIIYEPPVIIDP